MRRIHVLTQWSSPSGLAMEESMFKILVYREFLGLSRAKRIPDRVGIECFRNLFKEQQFVPKTLTVLNTALIAAPNLGGSSAGKLDSRMHQTNKRNMWHFGIKFYITAEAHWGLQLTWLSTTADDMTPVGKWAH